MTFILGSVCSDGVVLIADKKITYENRHPEYREKLSMQYYPIVFGSSGSVDLYERFLYEALSKAQRSHKITQNVQYATSGGITEHDTTNPDVAISLQPYLQDLEKSVKELNNNYSTYYGSGFDILLAVWTKDKGSVLYYIPPKGIGTKIFEYMVIGTGERLAEMVLGPLWRKEMTMEQVAKIGYFIIKYIEQYDLDYKVGVGSLYPQIYFVANSGEVSRAEADKLESYEKETNTRLEQIKNGIIDLSKI